MNTRDSVMKRVQAVKETGYVDEVIIEEYKGRRLTTSRNTTWMSSP